ncbi:MAG TPA: hypothetical protein VMU08_15490 [Rhizomicrobium sp.]|nr:hypothetical protein [Rhizomicrobium sp.]
MTPFDIARKHFDAALAEAASGGVDAETVARYMLDLVVTTYLKTRAPKDVQAELQFVAENCDPDSDFVFMRP